MIPRRFKDAASGGWQALLQWGMKHSTAKVFSVMVAIAIGLSTGICASLLKYCIRLIEKLVGFSLGLSHSNWIYLIVPILGIVICGFYQRHIIRMNIEHGLEIVERKLKAGDYKLGDKLIYSPIVASSITLGCGGSAGGEGPIATAGAAIGSKIGQMFRLDPNSVVMMAACGAGAGIAGIFIAPVGGTLFTLEVLGLEMNTMSVIILFIACATSSMTAYLLNGCNYDMNFIQSVPFDISIMPYVIVLGLVGGVYCTYYSFVMVKMRRWFDSMKKPIWRNVISGSILAVLIYIFPTLYGEGYDSVSKLINGHHVVLTDFSLFFGLKLSPWLLMLLTGGILLCKPVATCSSNSGGGVAGDFAPTLFTGAVFGFLFATAFNTAFHSELPIANFAFIGMAAVMAGAVRAPLMAVFIAVEIADGYQFLLPALVSAAISYCVVLALSNYEIDRRRLIESTVAAAKAKEQPSAPSAPAPAPAPDAEKNQAAPEKPAQPEK